jgi:MtfA peptidase
MRIVPPAALFFTTMLALILGGALGLIVQLSAGMGWWVGVVLAAGILYVGLRRPLRRYRAAKRVFPDSHRRWLKENVPFYAALDWAGRKRFERDAMFYLADQHFEAVDGVNLTDEMKLSVAAGAALMLHGRPDWEMPTNRTVLFYPERFGDDYYADDYAEFDGMVHSQGPVILSAPAVEESWAWHGNGSNVVLHELAHLFDFANSNADGIPTFVDPGSVEAWKRLVRKEMRLAAMGKSILRRYAGTHPAEFFAVGVENFFDRPHVLRQRAPEVYEAMKALFNLDPARVLGETGAARAPEESAVN